MTNIKNLSDFVSKEKIERAIEGVLIMPDKIVATDSYKLIEITTETGVPAPVIVKMPKGLKTFESVTAASVLTNKGATYQCEVLRADKYPKYEAVIPAGEPVATVRVNAEYLEQIASACKGAGQFHAVEIAFHGELKPLVFTTNGIRALLMPMTK